MKIHKHKKYQSVITLRIVRSLRRLTSTLMIAALAASIFTVGRTNAGFFDIEESQDNVWTAGSLDGRVTFAERFNVTGMNPDQSPDGRIVFLNEGSLDFRYDIKFRKTGGNDLLCQSLQLVAKRDGSIVYTGALADFKLLGGQYSLAPFESDTWDMILSLPTNAGSSLEHLTCQWDVDFLAWQVGLPSAADGFFDEESATPNSVGTDEWLTPGDVIINEIMWMGSNGETSDEWIELKNMTKRDINLSNWNIKQGGTGTGSGAHIEIPNGYSIKANGYFLLTKKKWNETAIALSADLSKSKGYTHIAGMKLEDEGEELVLENKDTIVMDRTPLGAWAAGTDDTLKQSMERNDIPGDGSLSTNWHTCVSGAANSLPYWDTPGVNFGTPLAANLSPIVMNEFVANPVGDDSAVMPEGEWIELYNIVDEDIDVANWYFTNHDDEVITITADRTVGGSTTVPGHGALVVFLNANFLDNDKETLSLFAPHSLDTPADDVREDVVEYEHAAVLPHGKSFARFPDGIGVWIDPETTPGEENLLTGDEHERYQLQAYETCFVGEELDDRADDALCSPLFLEFIGLLDEIDDTTVDESLFLDLLEKIQVKETAALMSLVQEDGVITPEEEVFITLPEILVEEEESHDEESEEVAEEESGEAASHETDTSSPEQPVSEEGEVNQGADSITVPEEAAESGEDASEISDETAEESLTAAEENTETDEEVTPVPII